uniref:Ovule protein n=1 Tax=Taenia asiatica TaxID=60517 RepID=A0A0R3VWD9_TAEAS
MGRNSKREIALRHQQQSSRSSMLEAHQNNQTTFKSSMFYNQGTKEHEYIPMVKCANLVVTQGVKAMIGERPIYGKRG